MSVAGRLGREVHGTEGLQAARVIRAELPSMAIIVLSAHVGVEQAILPPGPAASD
jgi:hypothetical protein